MSKFTPELIAAAIVGFELQKQRIDTQIAELRILLAGGPTATLDSAKPKRQLSPEAINRIREAQKRRWAAFRGESTPASLPAPKAKRKLSAEGRRAIVAALKKRWAAKKAASA